MKHPFDFLSGYRRTPAECLHCAGPGMIDRSLDSMHKMRVVVRGQKFAICTLDIFSNSSANKKGTCLCRSATDGDTSHTGAVPSW